MKIERPRHIGNHRDVARSEDIKGGKRHEDQ
jgi:hypothetical protein